MRTLIILPIHLYNFKLIKKILQQNCITKIIIYEEPKLFTAFNYHKQKLIMHRASCKYYYDYLRAYKLNVLYVEYNKPTPVGVDYIFDTFDFDLYNKYKKVDILDSPNFLLTKEVLVDMREYYNKNKKFSHTYFYNKQKKLFNITYKSYDKENRKKIPADVEIPATFKNVECKYIKEAKAFVETHFKNAYGEAQPFIHPITHKSANRLLKQFISNKLELFGPYQDASLSGETFLFHSGLSAPLNIGLLTDKEVLGAVINVKCSLQSKEGFIRQLLGWRNYCLVVYLLHGRQLKLSNVWKHNNRLTIDWWNGTTNITPVDDIIQNKILKYAYAHHIERLMYIGVWMFLNRISPHEVYKWFMELTIDAYEWVMVSNVYGMSQNANGDVMMKRLYIGSSNYIMKMSNYRKDKSAWHELWDSKYYCFINDNKMYFKKNYYYANSYKYWTKLSKKERDEILDRC